MNCKCNQNACAESNSARFSNAEINLWIKSCDELCICGQMEMEKMSLVVVVVFSGLSLTAQEEESLLWNVQSAVMSYHQTTLTPAHRLGSELSQLSTFFYQ